MDGQKWQSFQQLFVISGKFLKWKRIASVILRDAAHRFCQSFVCSCHTVSRQTLQSNFIYSHKKSTAFSGTTFTKIRNFLQYAYLLRQNSKKWNNKCRNIKRNLFGVIWKWFVTGVRQKYKKFTRKTNIQVQNKPSPDSKHECWSRDPAP
jgi:hypothetical protein